jgi:DNA repair exonuclease SbcCD ATPase subunit
MSQRVDNLTQNVKGETENMRTKFSSLEQNLKDLSSGGLFGQIDSMIQELKRLNDLNDKYEVRHFLTCAELERRAIVVEEMGRRLQHTDETLIRCEQSLRESERLREEDKSVLKSNFEYELTSIRNTAQADKQRLERRVQELQADLSRKDNMIEELNRNMAGVQDGLSKAKIESQAGLARQAEIQRQLEGQLKNMQADHAMLINQLKAQFQVDMDTLRQRLSEEKLVEVDNQKRLISEYYSQQISAREAEIQRIGQVFESHRSRLVELERENQGLHTQLDQRTREAGEFKDQLVGMRRTHEEYSIKVTENNRAAIQKAIADKEKELRDKLDLELSKAEKELKEKKALVLSLEQKIIFMEKENQRNSSRLTDMTVERDELKSKLIDAEKRLGEEIRMVEETLTIQLQEQHGEINRLLIQNRELNESFSLQFEQERNRANTATADANLLRSEIAKLKELSEKRNREIEEWRVKYKSYITGEE